jgi:hypothetical protein
MALIRSTSLSTHRTPRRNVSAPSRNFATDAINFIKTIHTFYSFLCTSWTEASVVDNPRPFSIQQQLLLQNCIGYQLTFLPYNESALQTNNTTSLKGCNPIKKLGINEFSWQPGPHLSLGQAVDHEALSRNCTDGC